MDITGASALVTGGSSGLGAATAAALTAAGAHVVLVDLAPPSAETLARFHGRAVFAAADVRNEEEVRAALDTADALGPLRVLVNCAGVATAGRVVGRQGPLPLADFERTIGINLIGTFNTIRLAAERMAATEAVGGERGVIINTASVAAFDGQIGQAAYAASKGAIAAMTLPIARELAASLIRVMTIAPGVFETPMMASMTEEVRASLGAQVPHPSRLGRPDEFAALVAHIIDNAYLNGETIRLDGTIRMAPR